MFTLELITFVIVMKVISSTTIAKIKIDENEKIEMFAVVSYRKVKASTVESDIRIFTKNRK